MLRALGRRHAAAAAAVAAGLGLVATRRQSECDAAPAAPHITGVLVLFRHGARSPVFALPDNDGQVYDAVTAAPPHAPEVTISNARNAWGGNKNGLLTTVGWAQGEALGRHLRRRYGAPAEPPIWGAARGVVRRRSSEAAQAMPPRLASAARQLPRC